MQAYRSGEPTSSVLLDTPVRAAAYAAYRMPATAAALAAVLAAVSQAVPGWAPASHLDLGAGTGAAAFAVAGTLPSVGARLLLEQAEAAVELGQHLLSAAGLSARWQPWRLGQPVEGDQDLVTAGYLLGELDEAQQSALVAVAAGAAGPAGTVVVVEPGSPAGHARIVTARTRLLAAGFTVAAPCPHQLDCPLAGPRDWCHLAVRLQRSARQRALKAGSLSYEDETFAYVAATRLPVQVPGSRVLRRPSVRKGLVTLTLCEPDGQVREQVVSKRQGERYRAARDIRWGESWPTGAPSAEN